MHQHIIVVLRRKNGTVRGGSAIRCCSLGFQRYPAAYHVMSWWGGGDGLFSVCQLLGQAELPLTAAKGYHPWDVMQLSLSKVMSVRAVSSLPDAHPLLSPTTHLLHAPHLCTVCV